MLIVWSDMSPFEGLSHACTLFHAVTDTINQAELRRKIVYLVCDLDNEQWLVNIAQSFAVDVLEVRRDINGLAVVHELMLQWARIEVDVLNNVAAAVAPVCNDWLAAELKFANLLGLMSAVRFLTDFAQTFQTSLGRHELEDVVDGKNTAHLALVGRGLES